MIDTLAPSWYYKEIKEQDIVATTIFYCNKTGMCLYFNKKVGQFCESICKKDMKVNW